MKQLLPPKTRTLILLILSCSLISVSCARLAQSGNSNRADLKSNAPLHININTASAKEIEQLPGIGPVLAERIVAYREQNGRFKRREDVMMVNGISEKKYEEVRSMIVVE